MEKTILQVGSEYASASCLPFGLFKLLVTLFMNGTYSF